MNALGINTDGVSYVEALVPKENNVEVSVRLNEMIDSKDDLEKAISPIQDPQTIMWFQGRKGVRVDWFEYCRDTLVSTIRKVCNKQQFILYDLRNWSALKSLKVDQSVETKSRVIKRIANLKCPDITCLDSAKYFKFLKETNDPVVTRYVNETLWKRDFIWKKSEGQDDSGIKLKQSLGEWPLIEAIKEKDASKAYSGLQYVEGIYLVSEMVKQKLSQTDVGNENLEIVFLLPNDEYLYYFDEERSFQKDLSELLSTSGIVPAESKVKVNVTFIPFKWRDSLEKRPYLSDSEKVKLPSLDSLRG